jgi:hypothetical protein
MSTTMNIFDICKSMQAEGYEYASLTEGSCLKTLDPVSANLQSFHHKPDGNTVYFSKLVRYYPDDEEEDEEENPGKKLLAPQWYDFVVYEDYKVSEYASKGLLFAKFDNTRLISNSDPRFKLGGDFRHNPAAAYYPALPHWNAVGAKYAGIHVDPRVESASDIFPAWDVDTVCIWDASVVTELRWFENAGTPWTYDVLSSA